MPPAPVSSKADFHLAGEIKPLTSLRFIAASFVLLHHLQGVLFIPKGSFDGFQLGNAVSFFFVLSGFILTCSYQSRIASIRYRDFLLVRFARIWPAHIAVLLLCVFWLVPAGFEKQMAKLSTIELGQIIFLLQSWTPDRAVFWGLNAPAWTISVELFFYACFPLLILGLRNYRWKTLIGMALILIAYFWAVDSFASFPDPFTSFGYGEAMPLIRLPEFMLGILLGQSLLNSPRLQEWAATPSKTLWTIIEIGVLAAMIWANAYGLKVGAQIKGMLGEVTGIWAAAIFP
ncbi:MAG: acyltransferase family protein, partial [Mangrovicoccus sp.]